MHSQSVRFFSAQDLFFKIWLFYRYILDYISPFLCLLSASYLLWIFSTLSQRSTYLRHWFSPFCLSISSSEFGHLNHKSFLPLAGIFIDVKKDIRAFKKVTYVLSSPDLHCSPSLLSRSPPPHRACICIVITFHQCCCVKVAYMCITWKNRDHLKLIKQSLIETSQTVRL